MHKSHQQWISICNHIDRDGLKFSAAARIYNTCRETISNNYKRIRADNPYMPSASIKSTGETVLVIPDMHHPFCHPDALEFLRAVKKRFAPTTVVCLGDEVDFHAFSRWPKNPDGLTAGKELQAAIDHLVPFYIEFPDVKVCVSNHTIRPKKMMKDMGIPRALWPEYSKMLNAPDGWVWKENWIIDNVRYMHGDQGRNGKFGWCANTEIFHSSVVVGHMHSRAGVVYDNDMFNMNTGCLIDNSCAEFDYNKHSAAAPNLGCGLVFSGKTAHFVPLLVDSNNRWTGKL